MTELILEIGKKFYLSTIKDPGTGKIVSHGIVLGIMKPEIYQGNKHYKFKDLRTVRKQIKEYINFYNNERITLKMERLIVQLQF